MQLVQRTMLPGSGPAELAEVLLGGLVRRAEEEYGPDAVQWYEMDPDVREALLSTLGRDEAVLVLKHCSEYIEQHFGKGRANFPALALAQLAGAADTVSDASPERLPVPAAHPLPAYAPGTGYPSGQDGDNGDATLVPQPFAEVAARVLERFMPLPEPFRGETPGGRPTHPAVVRARTLLARFDAEGMVQDAIDAVQLLRGATGHERPAGADPELWAEYAYATLRLWEVQGGAELLREAETAAEQAVAHPHALRERAALARVLRAAATDRRRRGDQHGALGLLRRADREYAVACAAPGLDPKEALRLTLERVGALETQWHLGGDDSALLQGAVGMLEAFADIWPDRRDRPPELPLAHGRLLLRLAAATTDPEQARGYAEQACGSLRDALTAEAAQESPGGADRARERVRTRLDLVDALLTSGGDLAEAQDHIEEALVGTSSRGLRSLLHVRAGRVRIARYTESGDLRELRDAADAFALAAAGLPRDAAGHSDVLAEWGEALLRRAGAESAARAWEPLSQAIRVLRDCRTETPTGSRRHGVPAADAGPRTDPALPAARRPGGPAGGGAPLRPGRGGRGRWAAGRPLPTGAGADAVRGLPQPRLSPPVWTTRWRPSVRLPNPRGTPRRRPKPNAERLDAVELAAQAHHWRGMSYEAAARPRAAREAYRAARAEWSRLPDPSLGTGGPTAADTAERLAELE
ncbi:hypothetical protein ACQ4WX_32175 [Streptomyces lasalocidi]